VGIREGPPGGLVGSGGGAPRWGGYLKLPPGSGQHNIGYPHLLKDQEHLS
jgi:hypothetical protein